MIVDAQTNGKTCYDYEPFGEVLTGDPARQGYIDKEKDRESATGDYGERKYEMHDGRFMSVDPLWEKYRGWSPYHYAANNSLEAKDPTGFAHVDIYGPEAEEAACQIDAETGLSIGIDNTGRLTVSGIPQNEREARLVEAITRTDIIIRLHTATPLYIESGLSKKAIMGGLYEGSIGPIDGVVKATQRANLEHFRRESAACGSSVGTLVIYEVLEAYAGAIENPGLPYAPKYFEAAHAKAAEWDPKFGTLPIAERREGDYIYGGYSCPVGSKTWLIKQNIKTGEFSYP